MMGQSTPIAVAGYSPWAGEEERSTPPTSHSKWPRPLSDAAYHGVFGDIVKAIEPETEADPAAILVQSLAMFGSVIGRTAHFRVGADRHFLNLFVGIVGQTAKGRKGVSGREAKRIFEPIDADWVKGCNISGLSSGEGLIHAVRDAIEKQQPIKEQGRVTGYQNVVEDPGVLDKRLTVTESELASTFKVMAREGNTLSPIIRLAWDGDDLRTLTKSSPTRATAPHITIIGHITRDEILRHLEATEAANGFGNRFLWVGARRSKELPDGGGDVEISAHVGRLREAVQFARGTGELRRDVDARRLWHRVYSQLSAGRPGMLGAMTARAEAQVMRLACLYAVGDRSLVVGLPHLRAGLEVWRYCFDSTAFVFGDHLGDPTADDILRALRDAWPASLSRKEILHDVFHRNRSASDISRALQILADAKLAASEEDRSGGGRPAERWHWCQPSMHDLNDFNDSSEVGETGKVVKVVKVVGSDGEPAQIGGDDAIRF